MLECKICHITLTNEDVLKYNNVCPCCHTTNSFCEEYIMDIKRISTDESFVDAMIKLKSENPIEYQLKMNQFQIQKKQEKQFKKTEQESNKLHCPYCNSTDVKKISGVSKAGSVALWGIFAMGKVSKNYHCNKCKSDF